MCLMNIMSTEWKDVILVLQTNAHRQSFRAYDLK